jgi:ureidoglycolate hydrolase
MLQQQLVAAPISAEAFAPFGWVVSPRDDGDEFDSSLEPRLEGFAASSTSSSATSSVPRLYVMRLPVTRGRTFCDVARHDKVTQTLCCLGASLPWLLAVAPAEIEKPEVSDLTAFRIPPRVAVTLRRGTWHAGPLFDAPGRAEEGQGGISERAGSGGGNEEEKEKKEKEEDKGVDFLNLELSDTNSRDRKLFAFRDEGGKEEEIEVLWPAAE